MKNKLIGPKNDIMFHKLFGVQQNEPLLRSFINSILEKSGNEKIKSLTVEEKAINESMLYDEKLSILDIHVTTEKDNHINVEMQLINEYNMIERTLFYWSKMCLNQIKKGNNYNNLRKTITINLLNFKYIDCDDFHTWYNLYEDRYKFKLTDLIEIHFIEMKKFKVIHKNYNDKLHRWLEFIEEPDSEEVNRIMDIDREIVEAKNMLAMLRGDKALVELAERRELALMDEIARLEGARDKGKTEGIEITKKVFKLFQKGESIAIIAKKCEISEEEVKEILE